MKDKVKYWLGLAMVLVGVIAYREMPYGWNLIMWIPIWTGASFYGRFA